MDFSFSNLDKGRKAMRKGFLSVFGFALLALASFIAGTAEAVIHGVNGPVFNLTAKEGRVVTGDGNSIYSWGYANGNGPMQYPGVTMIVEQGALVTVNLVNRLPVPVSIVFPGQAQVSAVGGAPGVMTREARPGETVTYRFTAEEAGTYLYHSATRPELQVEMGLVGALIVRPSGFNGAAPTAYGHIDTAYDRETLFLLTEMDSRIHEAIEMQGIDALANTNFLTRYFPNYWFINGRNAPDTMAPAFVGWLPNQPYNSMPVMQPGERLLMRVISGGRDLHPFHYHGNHAKVIAKDGRLLQSAAGLGPDIGPELFTIQAVPGETYDAIFQWTGKGLGWDIYGTGPGYEHECMDDSGDGYDDVTMEWCADHGKEFPVLLPDVSDLTFGGFYSGSPFMGALESLPPGQGGLNPAGGFTFMWHSHTEKEMTNYDIFPGGLMTMLIIQPPGAPVME
ncbi:hypothetical protein BAC1_00558 [uncultured bacterium]|nr:hypothetical protein BAC1_00558 [uncultured bacterium]